MEINYLNTFLQVAATKNFTKTAQILGYSQSSISFQIQQLENTVGAKLFDRIGKKVALTQYGEELIPYAQQIVSAASQIEHFTRSENDMKGTIRFGMVESLFEIFFEEIFFHYHKRFPNVKLELTVDATATLQEELKKNQMDVAFLIDEVLPQTEWICWHSSQVQILVIANVNNPLCNCKELVLKDLSLQEFILMEDTAPYIKYFQNEMAKQNIEINSFIKMQNAGMARRLVEQGNFLAVLPEYTVKVSTHQKTIKILPVSDFIQSQFIQIILHKNKVITPQIKGLLEEIKKVLTT
ncbi:LysR family transcriptional regulator [Clostridium sp. MD294]|uniref:LysR family transcriptional regulator n=1 Tax=Clostridium sp. MD294 TaxID=97138 RepID=UPI0002C92310|nr:LysR family transcriptional regulator [Clostridium sp. MD294]USF31243.1 HTH-type transcriptional regulator YofA [Clostridium sp. MD294]